MSISYPSQIVQKQLERNIEYTEIILQSVKEMISIESSKFNIFQNNRIFTETIQGQLKQSLAIQGRLNKPEFRRSFKNSISNIIINIQSIKTAIKCIL